MWMAWLRMRFPRRESRHTFRPPEDTSMGAVPLKAAKRSRVGKRAMSPVTPDGGSHDRTDPEDVDGGRAGRGDHLLEPLLRLGELAVDPTQVIEELLGELDTGGGHRAVGFHLGQQQRCFFGVDLVGNAAGDQVA